MSRLSKSALSFGAGVLTLGVLIVAAPRAAHAIAATLVQVTNTAANPAVAEDVAKMASQNVMLVSSSGPISPHGFAALQQMFPNGTIAASPFVVPAGQELIVTTIDVLSGGGNDTVGIANTVSGVVREEFQLQDAAYSTQLQFPNGFVFPAGESVTVSNYGISAGTVIFTVHGYLTSN